MKPKITFGGSGNNANIKYIEIDSVSQGTLCPQEAQQ